VAWRGQDTRGDVAVKCSTWGSGGTTVIAVTMA
jgi:hypothetical protein